MSREAAERTTFESVVGGLLTLVTASTGVAWSAEVLPDVDVINAKVIG
jgi:hypothetical protein